MGNMGLLDDITLGRYEPRESILHRLDPRLKLCGLPLLVIAVFASHDPVRLGGLALLAAVLILISGIDRPTWWRGFRMLRWLFLFTLLLHLLLSPGRTLMGVGWLSYDGLLRGSLVCSQLALAVLFSSLLTLTTSPREVAGACASLLSPLARLGFPVRDTAILLLLVLHFVPILREETIEQAERSRAEGIDPSQGALVERALVLGRMIAPLLLRLVDRADALAGSIASGEDVIGDGIVLRPFWPPRPADLAFLCCGILFFTALYGLPR
jgi:energy-coupling factor transport system permease protein